MLDKSKITNISNLFVYLENGSRILITEPIKTELLIYYRAEFEFYDRMKHEIGVYLDQETEKKNELTEQKSFANITEEFIHEQRIKEKLTESTGAYEVLNQVYQDISNKLERYYKYIYLLDRSV
jgi:hypothetical protein